MEVLVLTNTIDKKCTRCGRVLPTTSFYRKGDNLQHWCISCQKDYRRTRQAEATINKLGFKDVPLGKVIKTAGNLTSKQRTDLRNSIKYIAKKIK